VGELTEGWAAIGVAFLPALWSGTAPNVALEPFKKICPAAGPNDEDVASIVLIPFAAEIAEGT
jgi:hypothetical protein